MRRDRRDRLFSINKGALIAFLEFDGLLPDWNSFVVVLYRCTHTHTHTHDFGDFASNMNDGNFSEALVSKNIIYKNTREICNICKTCCETNFDLRRVESPLSSKKINHGRDPNKAW